MEKTSDPSSAIEVAYEAYSNALFRHCYFRVFNRELGKELMQETFLRAWAYLKKGQTVENMRAFLYRIANNLIIDHVRRRKEMSLDALNEQGFDPPGEDEVSVVRPLEEQYILLTMQKLPVESREMIVMRYIDGLKPQEISELLGIATNTVSVRIHRAMKELKTHLEPRNREG